MRAYYEPEQMLQQSCTWYYNGLIVAVQEADREPQEGACLNEEMVRSPEAWNRG